MFLGEQQFGLFEGTDPYRASIKFFFFFFFLWHKIGVDWDSDEIVDSYPKELEYYKVCCTILMWDEARY